jgi:hypothetical protein
MVSEMVTAALWQTVMTVTFTGPTQFLEFLITCQQPPMTPP